MNKIIKAAGVTTGIVLALAVVLVAILYFTGQARFQQKFDYIQPQPVAIPIDAQSLAVGQKWANTLCTNCHAADLSGRPLIEDPTIGIIGSPNLTRGAGGIASRYSDLDWVRTLRHGLRPDNTPLMGMPSEAFYFLSDQDLGALIAYLKTVPPVDNQVAGTQLKPFAYILVSLGTFGDVFPAENIPHDVQPPTPTPGVSKDYGRYLVQVGDCNNCHGSNLSGGESPVPGSPPGPNLTPAGTLAFWSPEEFINTIRTGTTPYGRQLNPDYMPWKSYNNLSDEELTAILLYLQSLPAVAAPEE